MVLVNPSLNSPKSVEGTCDQWRLWSDCADGQAVSRCWSCDSFWRFCRSQADMLSVTILPTIYYYFSEEIKNIHRDICLIKSYASHDISPYSIENGGDLFIKGSIPLKNRHFVIQGRFNKLIYGINTIINCGIWQPVKFLLVSLLEMKWLIVSLN